MRRTVPGQRSASERVTRNELSRIPDERDERRQDPARQRRGGAAHDRVPVRRRPLDVGVAVQRDIRAGMVHGGGVVIVAQEMNGQPQADR